MKLFICITKSDWGGAQKYVYDIATGVPKDKFEVSVLLGGDGELKKRLDLAGIRTWLLKNSQRDIDTKKEFGLFFELMKIFKKEKPDIVHLNSSKMGFVGALAARIAGVKKIIFTAHGWAFNEDRNIISKFLFKIIHILTIILCNQTIAVSERTKKQIPKLFRKKIVVIKNGLREIDFKNKKEARDFLKGKIIEKTPDLKGVFKKDLFWIGTISELHKNKGLEYMVEAISKINENIVFVVIGEGEERKKLQDLIIKLGLSDKIFLIGKVDMASSYLKAFDIFTLTSITEAFPYAILEAGFAGSPIIVSNVGGIPEVINRENGILVEPRNPEIITNKIGYLLNNPEKAKLLGDNLKKEVENEFTLENMLKKTVELYNI